MAAKMMLTLKMKKKSRSSFKGYASRVENV